MPRDLAEPQSLAEHFLSMSGGDARAALEACSACCEVLAARLLATQAGRGFARLPRLDDPRIEPKKQQEPL